MMLPLLDELAIKPNSGRIMARRLGDGEALVGILHFPDEFTPKEGSSYMAIFSVGQLHVVPSVIDADIPDAYQGGMEGALRGDCWRKTTVPGALTVRFVEAFSETNGWAVYGATNLPVFPLEQYHRGHAFVEVSQGSVKALAPVDGVHGNTVSQLLSNFPIWPDANGVPHVLPTTEARWRQTYYDYSLLQAKFGAGEISESQLIDAVRADPKIFHIRSYVRDDMYCRYLAALRDAGGIQPQRPMTVEDLAAREELSSSTLRRLMHEESATDAATSKQPRL